MVMFLKLRIFSTLFLILILPNTERDKLIEELTRHIILEDNQAINNKII